MISFRNVQNNPLFQDFVMNHSCSDILEQKNDTFRIILPGDYLAAIFDPEDYMSLNSNYIFYNERKCNEIGLTDEERFSFIAHELGHFYDTTDRNGGNQQDREINADNFAVKLGLGEYLLSALKKLSIVFSGVDKERIDERIRILSE